MRDNINIYSVLNKVSAIFMILALLWLTVSTPFVFAAQKELAKKYAIEKNSAELPATEEESSSPLGNNTEEKAPSGTSLSDEYLHDTYAHHHFGAEIVQQYRNSDAATYIAFHGELLVPPPNVG